MYIYIFTYLRIHIYIYICIWIYIYVYTYTYVYIYIYIYMYTYMLCIFIHIYLYTYTYIYTLEYAERCVGWYDTGLFCIRQRVVALVQRHASLLHAGMCWWVSCDNDIVHTMHFGDYFAKEPCKNWALLQKRPPNSSSLPIVATLSLPLHRELRV